MKQIKKIQLISLVLLFISAIAFSSCSSPRKCNNKKGTKTPMGLM